MTIQADLTKDHDLSLAFDAKTLEAANVSQFLSQLDEAGGTPYESAVIDLGGIEMIDSSGVGALLQVHKRLAESRGPVVLKNVGAAVVSVLELLRLHRVFEIEVSRPVGS